MVKLAVVVTAFAALTLAAAPPSRRDDVVVDDVDDNTSIVIGSIVPDLPTETGIPHVDDDNKPSFTLTGDLPAPTGHGAGRSHTNGTEVHRNGTASRAPAPTTSAFVAGAPINQGITWSFAAVLVGLVGYFV